MSANETSVPSAPSAPDSASEGSSLRHRVTEASSESTGFTSFPGPSSSSSSSQQQSTNRQNQENNADNGSFECNICLDTAKDAVVSLCGHLFCWPCVHQWLETKPNRQVCPVCKAAISREKVIPLYGRGSSRQDPRAKLPPRPPGQRTEPEYSSANFPGFGFGDGGIHMSFGIGAFPFGFFASSFNFNDARGHLNVNNEQQPEDIFIRRIFLWIALILILWLLVA